MSGLILVFVGVFVVGRILQGVADNQRRTGTVPPVRPAGTAPTTMTELLAEMRAQLQAAQQRAEAPTTLPRRLPGTAIKPSERQAVVQLDQDDGAEALVQRRIDAAEARNVAWQPSDHKRFDAEIRKRATPVVPRKAASTSLRQAMIWREVLSPPLALRDRDEI
ncbi:MAG: hypothetical protein V4503_00735 [Gemmatimonadota bacterium]